MSYIKKYCDGWDDGYASGLDAAREAINKIPREDGGYCHVLHACDVEAAIDALREKPLASGGIYAGPPIPLGDGCVIPKSAAIDALR